MERQGARSRIKLDLDQHVEVFFVFFGRISSLKIICILIVYLIKRNIKGSVVYYSQGTDI